MQVMKRKPLFKKIEKKNSKNRNLQKIKTLSESMFSQSAQYTILANYEFRKINGNLQLSRKNLNNFP